MEKCPLAREVAATSPCLQHDRQSGYRLVSFRIQLFCFKQSAVFFLSTYVSPLSVAQKTNSEPGRLIFRVSKSHTIRHTHTHTHQLGLL